MLNNPFAPGSGAVPTIWVGRDDELADVSARLVPRRGAGLFERGRTFLGDPGLGKSVLVNRVASERRAAGDLVSAPLRLARGRDPLAALAGSLTPALPAGERLSGRLAAALERVQQVGLAGSCLDLRAPVEDRYDALAELLRQLSSHARQEDVLLVVRVDEVQNLAGDSLSQLLTLLGDALEATSSTTDATGAEVEQYAPVVVLLSGLPEFPERAARAGATFSRRFATSYLEPFTDDEVRAALELFFGTGFGVLTADGTSIARAVGRGSSSQIGSTLQGLAGKRLLRLDADGYRVVSRALARELAEG